MPIINCKNCGEEITVPEGRTSVVCKHCGSFIALTKVSDEVQEKVYTEAAAMMEAADDIKSYEKAAEALFALNGYKDSVDLAVKCREEIDRLKKEKDKAAEITAGLVKKAALIAAILIVLCIAAAFIVVRMILPAGKYKAAQEALETADYITAYETLESIGSYKDSKELMFSIEDDYKQALISEADIGSCVILGTYEQDNNAPDGVEAIEWIALDKQDGRALLLSVDALDCKPYNKVYEDVTWETCTLRAWLNDEFYNTAFSEKEKEIIALTTNINEDNTIGAEFRKENGYEPATIGGSDTEDRVFLLSIQEVQKYFGLSDSDLEDYKELDDLKAVPSEYATASGAWTADDYAFSDSSCWWWLRSPGDMQKSAASVYRGGSVAWGGDTVSYTGNCVRPAVWINLED